MSIAMGSDEAGFEMKEMIKNYLEKRGETIEDYGVYDTNPVLYPDIAVKVAEAIMSEKHSRGILICGTGIGMAITANKVPGVRAAVCHDSYSAERARKSNNAQILTMGSRVIGLELAKKIIDVWLESEFQGGNSLPKLNRITEYEQKYMNK